MNMAEKRAQRSTEPMEILVVGAGIGGLALASFLLLSQLKHPNGSTFQITIVERSPSMRGMGQNIDIRSGGKELLQKLGLEEEVRAATTGEQGVRIIDTNGRPVISSGVDKTGKVETATGEIEILRGRLAELLYERCNVLSKELEAAGGRRVEFVFGDYLDSIQQPEVLSRDTKVQVQFAKNREVRSFDIVVGADGLQSRTRSLAFSERNPEAIRAAESETFDDTALRRRNGGLPNRPTPEMQRTPHSSTDDADLQSVYLQPLNVYNCFYSIPASLLSDVKSKHPQETEQFADDWRLWYHAPGRRSIMVRPADDKSRLTVLTIIVDRAKEDPRLDSVAVVTDDRKAAVQRQKQLVAEYYQDAGWECEKLMEGMRAADDFYYDIVAQVKMDRWSRGQVCLLGDAAHCASPFSGMGTTLALLGGYNLAGALTKHATESSNKSTAIASALSDYESTTRPFVVQAQKLPPGMPWVLHPQTTWGVWVMHCILGFIWWSGLQAALAKLASRGKDTSKSGGLVDWEKR